MQTQNRLLDDLARVATSALGVAAGMRTELEARLRDQFERVLSGMDLVTREEFDAVKAMAAKARAEQEDLGLRLAALEAGPGAAAGAELGGAAAKAAPKAPAKAPGPKKAAKKGASKGAAKKA